MHSSSSNCEKRCETSHDHQFTVVNDYVFCPAVPMLLPMLNQTLLQIKDLVNQSINIFGHYIIIANIYWILSKTSVHINYVL